MSQPFTVTQLCGHTQSYMPDCLATTPLAVLRAQPCPKCIAIKVHCMLSEMAMGTIEGERFSEEGEHFSEDNVRRLGDDSRVTYAAMAGQPYLCLPKGYPHSVAIKHVDGAMTTYEIIYRAR